MRFRHAAALALVIVAGGCESQANEDYRAQRATQRNPPKLTTTASSVLTAPQGSLPGWLLIVSPEEPRPPGASRAMTEAPLSQWLVKGTYSNTV